MMATNCAHFESNSKFLLEQLITARKEINNLRQQIKSLRYVHERDVSSIKRLLGLSTSGLDSFSDEAAQSHAPINSRSNEPSSSTANGNVLTCRPIGVVSTWFPNKRGTPRQPTVCSGTPGKITLFKSIFTNPEHALQGLEEFSHMWILFHFHKNDIVHVRAKVAPPRLNGIRTGVFSTRSPHRPSPIGLSLVKIIKIENCTIYFEGVDMIDQTPVLDIKPYIPHYDNPLHIENILQSVHSKKLRQNNTSPLSIDNPGGWLATDIDEVSQESHNHLNLTQQRENQPLLHTSPISSNSTSNSSADVSRDEELAMRLQAEEFQENLHFDIDNDNASYLEDNELAAIIGNRGNLNRIGFNSATAESSDEQNLGTSRLLEGADGPNAICGTDLDLISRRTLNLRLDDSSSSSSPIRMGVREAPDGEEGFDLSQPNVPRAPNLANNSNNSDLNFQTIMRQMSDSSSDAAVRVPDWISKPKTSTLSVVFNERSLLQLQEISNEKAEEKRQAVENVLKEDPRSVYLRQRYGNQFYTFLINDLHITCKFDDDKKIVTVFQIRHAGRTCECGQPEWQCTGHNHSSSSTFNQD